MFYFLVTCARLEGKTDLVTSIEDGVQKKVRSCLERMQTVPTWSGTRGQFIWCVELLPGALAALETLLVLSTVCPSLEARVHFYPRLSFIGASL